MLSLLPLLLSLQAPWTTDLLSQSAEWPARPDWVGPQAAATYSARAEEGTLTLRVDAARMKWLRPVRCAPREIAPWLVLRYRATGLGGGAADDDYFLWADDGSREGRTLLRCADLTADGEWRVLALQLDVAGLAGDPSALALQLIAGPGPAEVELTELRLAAEPPEDAAVLGAAPETAAAPVTVTLPDPDLWAAQPSWLGNPGPGTVGRARGLRFTCAEAGTGVKWSAALDAPLDLTGFRYAVLRYRAAGGGASDYAVCAMGKEAYAALALPTELAQDGGVHTVCLPLSGVLATVPSLERLAVQVQARKPGAWLELLELKLTGAPERESLADLLPACSGLGEGWSLLDLPPGRGASADDSATILRAAGLSDAPLASLCVYRDVPFAPVAPALAPVIPLGSRGELRLAPGAVGRELYLLAAVGMIGDDQPARGGGRLRRAPDPDRFVVEVSYSNGARCDCVPSLLAPSDEGDDDWGLARGLCVLRCPLPADAAVSGVRLLVRSDQIGLSLLGATLRAGAPRHPTREDGYRMLPPRNLAPWLPPTGECIAHQVAGEYIVETPEVRAVLVIGEQGLELTSLWHKSLQRELLAEPVRPLLRVRVDGEEPPALWIAEGHYMARVGEIGISLAVTADPSFGVRMEAAASNLGERPHEVEVLGPVVRLRMPGPGEPTYCFPDAAAVVSDRDTDLSGPYAGWGVRHQFLAASTADGAGGVALVQPNTEPIERGYRLTKRGAEVTLGVSYPRRMLAPGAIRELGPTCLATYAGDWHVALARYRAWRRGALAPIGPRPDWFRRVWNFRQRFLHWLDPLWADRTKPIDLMPALDEAERAFGGAEYLHLFDWGNVPDVGRVYGRPGDPDPADSWPGGYPALRDAIRTMRWNGVRVGLYIEGYLLETKGPLGQRIGEQVAIRDPEGRARYWPDATEVFACPAVEEWRAIQAETYRRAVDNLVPDGMYVDEFGFCSDWRQCFAPTHGHAVPDNPALNEAGMLRRIRAGIDAARPGVALYSEESPPDVNAPLLDGSFTYSMQRALNLGRELPLNLYRFVDPSFKTIEILVCDKPTADWVSGPAWVFWGGEGIWLEGPAEEWFAPETRAMIRRCHALLLEHQEAFASDDVTPLVPTLAEGIYANRFVGPIETVYTLYNARHTSYDGPVLALPQGTSEALDAWSGGTVLAAEDYPGGHAIRVRLAPQSVGCIVVKGR